MFRIKFFSCCFLVALIGCATNYKLEKKSVLSFNESYYNLWSSGVKGGGAGFNVYLVVDKSSNLDKRNTKIEGIYFKEKYTQLKDQGFNKYQAFVKEDNNLERLEIDNSKEVKAAEIEKKKIPFNLKESEAVVSYLINDEQKYVKIKLTKKETINFPM